MLEWIVLLLPYLKVKILTLILNDDNSKGIRIIRSNKYLLYTYLHHAILMYYYFDAVFGGGDVCNSGKSVNSGFGKGYVYLTKSKDELKREFLHVKVNYKLNKVKIMVMFAHSIKP